MADIAGAVGALTAVLLKLGQILIDEANLMGNAVKGEICSLKKDLVRMQSYIKDAENKLDGDHNNLIRQWVSDVTDLAYDAEDVIDTFLLKLGSVTRRDTGKCCFPNFTRLSDTHKLGSELQHLKKEANGILRRRTEYGLTTLGGTSSRRMASERLKVLRESSSDLFNEYTVGLAVAVEHLLKELREGDYGRFILSIHGMGGIGKTTLARKLYNELEPERFPLRAWICVSQSYTPDDLLKRLIRSIIGPRKEVLEGLTSTTSMKTVLWHALSKSNFVVVLDDVWDKEAWKSVSDAFPNDRTKGRVIITTRKIEVAKANPAYVYELKGLDYEDSWELFCRKTFHYDKCKDCPPHLKPLGEDMVRKCNGLPLAIVTLGALLSTKFNDIREWEAVKGNFWKQLKQENILIDVVLSHSFNELPHHLRLCLLYVAAMFPEDSEIPVSKLILLWEAEGFASQEKSKLYFNELVGVSLLQKNSEDWLDSTCRVHGLIRDLAIKKAQETSFSRFYGEKEKFDLSDSRTQRRLAMCNIDFNTISVEYKNCSLRTMRLWHDDLYQSQLSCFNEFLQPCHVRFDKLRVLDVKVSGKMPYVHVGKLIHLRYLSLESEETFEVSKSLGDLKLLQTLYVASTQDIVTLPKTVVKLQNLKHLQGFFGSRGDMAVSIGKLTGLKTLEIADCESWCDLDTASLLKLQNLSVGTMAGRKSGQYNKCNSKNFLPKFANLKGLRTINLSTASVYEVSEILKECPLVTHFITMDTSKNPSPSSNPELSKFGRRLEVIQWEAVRASNFQAIISSLEKLPKLRALQLSVWDKEDLYLSTSEDAFPQLQTLCIRLTTYHHPRGAISMELSVKESGMSLLRKLYVDVPDNIIVPDGLKQKILPMR